MQKQWIAMTVIAMTCCIGEVAANNLQVTNVTAAGAIGAEGNALHIRFDLRWENSWRNEVNHDAAWVFVKFRVPGQTDWEHAYLSPDSADHEPAAGSTIDAVADGAGVFVYSDAPYAGTVDYVNTRVMWQYATNGYDFTTGDEVEISVHAIEMVYVPEGPFYVGSGGAESGSFTDGAWHQEGQTGDPIPYLITSEAALPIGPESNKLWGVSGSSGLEGVGDPGELPATFPKGYAAFYCMKYSITQGQYADFLNLLTETQAGNRAVTGGDSYTSRHIITGEWPNFSAAAAPDRANPRVSREDVAAYAAWAGLRPMTELEYEKACRGPETPVANEYALGTDAYTSISGLTGEDGSGTETYAAGNLIVSGSNPVGPVRVGIFAGEGTTREQAGASYWGIMELSGNVFERCVNVSNGRAYEGAHGNGVLSPTGSADIPEWSGATTLGLRGSSWTRSANSARVSDRKRAVITSNLSRDTRFNGGRAVRTAP